MSSVHSLPTAIRLRASTFYGHMQSAHRHANVSHYDNQTWQSYNKRLTNQRILDSGHERGTFTKTWHVNATENNEQGISSLPADTWHALKAFRFACVPEIAGHGRIGTAGVGTSECAVFLRWVTPHAWLSTTRHTLVISSIPAMLVLTS